ncbi:restriction endonuclease subunit S [Empedobacter sp.]|uniref:restriction endonuclease subunit S n=1 Tax=Empedobacter sp. TaxID=1927715 RepID=UPI0028A0C580|nr:restriction endonuclease subunit S [Empedobacter sp.]
MSKLDELLQGVDVEWKALGDISEIYGGLKGKNKSDFTDGNAKYVTYKNIYNNIEVDLEALEMVKVSSNENQYEVKYGDVLFTGSSENASEAGISSAVTFNSEAKVFLNSFSFGLRFKSEIKILPEFSKYLFRSKSIRDEIIKTASGVTRYNVSKKRFVKIKIPIPCPYNPEKSLEIQQEIVRVLDELTSLTNQLTTELETERQNRKKQFEFFREQLFKEINLIKLGDNSVGEFIRGSGLQKKDFTETGVGCIHYGQLYTHYKTFAFETKTFVSEEFAKKARKASSGDLIIATTSENDDDVCKAVAWLGNVDIAVSSDACFYRHKFNPKYVAYYFQTEQFQKQKRKYITGTKVRRVNANDLAKILIPNPSLQEQERIVKLLDQFDATHTAIEEEITKEIKLRTQQYEYYREKLLSFPSLRTT